MLLHLDILTASGRGHGRKCGHLLVAQLAVEVHLDRERAACERGKREQEVVGGGEALTPPNEATAMAAAVSVQARRGGGGGGGGVGGGEAGHASSGVFCCVAPSLLPSLVRTVCNRTITEH